MHALTVQLLITQSHSNTRTAPIVVFTTDEEKTLSIREGEYLSLLHSIEFFSSIYKYLAEFRENFKQL